MTGNAIDKKELHNHESRNIGWVILFNATITIFEYFGGVFSGSLALISDAGHNLADTLSLILSYAGERFTKKKSTKRNTFGFKRVETLTAWINAVALWVIGGYILFEALDRYSSGEQIVLWIMLPVAFIGLIGNAVSLLVLRKHKSSSVNMRAAYLHIFYDTISSVAVIFSGILIYLTGFLVLDVVVSVFISLMIFYSGFGILRETFHIFMQGTPDSLEYDAVYEALMEVEGVKNVHKLHIWSINSREVFLSCHVCVDDTFTGKKDKIIVNANEMLADKYGITHMVIQVEEMNLCQEDENCDI